MKRGPKKPYKYDWQEVARQYAGEGVPVAEFAKSHNMSIATVSHILRKTGTQRVPGKRGGSRRMTEEDIRRDWKELVAMLEQGKSIPEIAKKCKCAQSTVRRLADRLGCNRRRLKP